MLVDFFTQLTGCFLLFGDHLVLRVFLQKACFNVGRKLESKHEKAHRLLWQSIWTSSPIYNIEVLLKSHRLISCNDIINGFMVNNYWEFPKLTLNFSSTLPQGVSKALMLLIFFFFPRLKKLKISSSLSKLSKKDLLGPISALIELVVNVSKACFGIKEGQVTVKEIDGTEKRG